MRPQPSKYRLLIVNIIFAMGFISLAPSSAHAQSPHAQWPYTTDVSPTWSIEVAGRVFDRPGDKNGSQIATNSITNEVLFDSKDATDLGTALGTDLKVNFKGRRFAHKWEFRTFVVDFYNTFEFNGPNINLPLLAGFSPDVAGYQYDSRIWSFELNCRKPLHPGFTFLAGPRFVSLDEETSFDFEQLLTTDFGSFNLTGDTRIETVNTLYGLQAGFEFNLPITQRMYVSSTVKVGGFGNPARFVRIDSSNVTDTRSFNQSKSTGSFLGEINGRLYCEIFPSCLSTFIGYDAMWIDGVALAPPQFVTAATLTGVDTTNTPFFQSITFGCQMQY